MKKISLLLAGLALASTSIAGPNHHGHRNYHHHNHSHNWVVPLVIGSVVGYAIANRAEPQQPVVIQQTVPLPPFGYRYEQILDANCNCYRLVLVPN